MSNDNNVIRLLGGKHAKSSLAPPEIKSNKLSAVFVNTIAETVFVAKAIAIAVLILLSFALQWLVRNIVEGLA